MAEDVRAEFDFTSEVKFTCANQNRLPLVNFTSDVRFTSDNIFCPLLQVQLRLTLGASQYICIRPMNVLHSELCKHHRRNTDSWPVSAIMKQQTSATSCRQY